MDLHYSIIFSITLHIAYITIYTYHICLLRYLSLILLTFIKFYVNVNIASNEAVSETTLADRK